MAMKARSLLYSRPRFEGTQDNAKSCVGEERIWVWRYGHATVLSLTVQSARRVSTGGSPTAKDAKQARVIDFYFGIVKLLPRKMPDTTIELITWLNARPYWVQEAVRRLQKAGTLTAMDDQELAELCKKPPSGTVKLANDVIRTAGASNSVTLKSLSDPKGIDELKPRKPLKFHDRLTVVYGTNGSGKSGYIRILKQVCGARMARKLICSVYEATPTAQSCGVEFLYNGAAHAVTWKPSDGVHGHLAAIEIYDTDSGSVYTTQDNEILFEPPLLALIQELINAAGRIEQRLVNEIGSLPSKKPSLPETFLGTKAAIWYAGMKPTLKNLEIDTGCKWDKADQEKLDALNKRLAETNPTEEAKKLRKRAENKGRLR